MVKVIGSLICTSGELIAGRPAGAWCQCVIELRWSHNSSTLSLAGSGVKTPPQSTGTGTGTGTLRSTAASEQPWRSGGRRLCQQQQLQSAMCSSSSWREMLDGRPACRININMASSSLSVCLHDGVVLSGVWCQWDMVSLTHLPDVTT